MIDSRFEESALKLDLANMELRTIDEALARRPALTQSADRYTKIEFLCSANGELLKLAHGYERYLMAHEQNEPIAPLLELVRKEIKKYSGPDAAARMDAGREA
jgi:hypothetical protein